jgi:hypothetical protein
MLMKMELPYDKGLNKRDFLHLLTPWRWKPG